MTTEFKLEQSAPWLLHEIYSGLFNLHVMISFVKKYPWLIKADTYYQYAFVMLYPETREIEIKGKHNI